MINEPCEIIILPPIASSIIFIEKGKIIIILFKSIVFCVWVNSEISILVYLLFIWLILRREINKVLGKIQINIQAIQIIFLKSNYIYIYIKSIYAFILIHWELYMPVNEKKQSVNAFIQLASL
jgi:hypothetical protein